MSPFPIDSFDDAFWVGEAIGFINDTFKICSSCGREFAVENDGIDDIGYICPECDRLYGRDDGIDDENGQYD